MQEVKKDTTIPSITPSLDGERKIEVDGKIRTLRMDFNALARAEQLTGKNMISAATWRDMTASDYRAVAYACLLEDDSTLTLEAVGRMMTPKNERNIADALLELYIGETAKPIDDKVTAEAGFKKDGGGGGQ